MVVEFGTLATSSNSYKPALLYAVIAPHPELVARLEVSMVAPCIWMIITSSPTARVPEKRLFAFRLELLTVIDVAPADALAVRLVNSLTIVFAEEIVFGPS